MAGAGDALTERRQTIADELDAAGIVARPYTSDVLTPPCAFVVPGQPYLNSTSDRADVMVGEVLVTLDVLLLVGEADPAPSANAIDQLVGLAFAVLDQWHHVTRVTRPGVVTPDPDPDPDAERTSYVGAVLTIETVIDRPTVPPVEEP